MSPSVGLVSFPDEDLSSRRPYSKGLHNLMDAEASKLVAEAYKRTEDVILKNRDKLQKVRRNLIFFFDFLVYWFLRNSTCTSCIIFITS